MLFQFTTKELDFAGTAYMLDLPGATAEAPEAAFGTLISNVLGIVLIIALLLLLLYLILGALEWMASGGESSKLQSARNRMMHAVIGIIILGSVMAVFMLIQYIMGVEFISFQQAEPLIPSDCTNGGPC